MSFRNFRNGFVRLLMAAMLVRFTQGSCSVELRSWGHEDKQKTGYVRVNGTVVVNYTAYDNQSFRGINTNLLNAHDCSARDIKNFDTFAYDTGKISQNLITYLKKLTPGTIVLGVSCDAAAHVTHQARDVMREIGIVLDEFEHRGKLTFATVIGRTRSTVYRLAPSGGDNLFMNFTVTGSEITDHAGSCHSDEFRCDSGQCIRLSDQCNGYGDCNDRSDENRCTRCRDGATLCIRGSRGGCVPKRFMSTGCSSFYRCIDSDDPQSCECDSRHYKCSSGECINQKHRCDGRNDCLDSSDELNCTSCFWPSSKSCSKLRCAKLYPMQSAPFYIASCDYFTCLDAVGSHVNCTCGESQFKCSSGECLSQLQRCDMLRDCSDGSDEINCPCTNTYQHLCNLDGRCLSSSRLCDGFRDCSDGSDEVDCQKCAHEALMPCGGRCIDRAKHRCNSIDDCADGSDEKNCTSCNHSELYLCTTSRKCIHRRCNLNFDCADTSAERDQYRCDGNDDCNDGSDEMNCDTASTMIFIIIIVCTSLAVIVAIIIAASVLLAKRRRQKNTAAVASAAGLTVRLTSIGGSDYAKQLSGIYDVIEDSDVNESGVYLGLNPDTKEDKSTKPASGHRNSVKAANNYERIPVDARRADASVDYLQLVDDQYLTVEDYE